MKFVLLRSRPLQTFTHKYMDVAITQCCCDEFSGQICNHCVLIEQGKSTFDILYLSTICLAYLLQLISSARFEAVFFHVIVFNYYFGL